MFVRCVANSFPNPWVGPWGTFDNTYYQAIIQNEWSQNTASNGLKQWGSFPSMLNVDMALFKVRFTLF